MSELELESESEPESEPETEGLLESFNEFSVPFLDFWAHKVAKFGLMLTKSPKKTVFISQNSKNGTEKSIFLDSRVCFRAQTLRAKRQNGLDHLRLYLTLQN